MLKQSNKYLLLLVLLTASLHASAWGLHWQPGYYWDKTPNSFQLVDLNDVPLSSRVYANPITVSGIDFWIPVSIKGGEYSVNNGAYSRYSRWVKNGDRIRVRQRSANQYDTITHAVLNLNGVLDSFDVTTLADSAQDFQLPAQSSGNADFYSEHFAGAKECGICHNFLFDEQGENVSIERDWSASIMANASRDPFWKAKVRSELNRNPHLADTINDKCSRCHAPMANFEAKYHDEPIKILDDGFLSANHARHDEAMDGVSCSLCHQIKDAPNLGTIDSFSGQYEIGDYRLIYGPYDDLLPLHMILATAYFPLYSQHIQEAEVCATCHDLKTPFVDEFGNVLSTTAESEFPEQMPYTEWLHSDFVGVESCQDCHMQRVNGVKISNHPLWLPERDNFATHEFVGANTFMLNILKDNKQQLGVTSNNFVDMLVATHQLLQTSASIAQVSQSLHQGQLDFTLQINNLTGHKLPTSYPSRRVIVHVVVKDVHNTIVFESGKINADGGVQGVDADYDALAYEPHYQLISSPEQVQIYEPIMGDSTGQVTYTLLRGMDYLKDNRLLPNGFDKANVPSDIKVAGEALDDSNFVGGSDQISYRISGLSGVVYKVHVELVYQTLAYAFARDLFTDSSAEVADFKEMYEQTDDKSTVITNLQFVVRHVN